MRDRLIELIKNAPKTDVVYGDIKLDKPIQTLQTIADYLLANGVIVPPYRAGTKVAVITSKTSNGKNLYIFEDTITHYRIVDGCTIMCFENHLGEADWNWKNVFLTREEAEKALKGGAE